MDALLHRVSQEPRLILSGGPLFPGPWRHQMNPVFGWQINKEREVHVEGHPEGFYEPGLGVAYITFTQGWATDQQRKMTLDYNPGAPHGSV